jgi:phytoene desaturase
MRSKNANVVVVGAGPGGLASAMLLASNGANVTVLEKQPTVGGRTNSIKAQGYTFDIGPTFFMYPQALQDIFQAAGRNMAAELPMERLDPHYRLKFANGGEIMASANINKMRDQIASYSPEDAMNLDAFLTESRKKFKAVKPALEKDYSSWKSLLDWNLVKSLPVLKPWQSVDGNLRKFFKDERTRLAFSFQTKYLGMSPFRCPSLFTILSYLEYDFGIYHPIGGCAAISHSMARVAEQMGVRIETGVDVGKIEFQGRKATGVQTSKENYKADAVVMNADFAMAAKQLIPNELRPSWSDKKIDKAQYSCSTFMLYLGVDADYSHLPHHNIHISEDYEKNLREIEDDHVLPESPSFYVQNASATDPTLAPAGKSALYVLVPVSQEHPNIDWSREAPKFRKKILGMLAKLGFEGVEERIEFEQMVTPADWRQEHRIHKGAVFNLAHTYSQMLYLRPHNRMQHVDGVYLVGGGTHPGSGLPVIFESARISSRLLCEDFGLTPHAAAAPLDAMPPLLVGAR